MDKEYIERCQKDEFLNPQGVCVMCGKEGLHSFCAAAFAKERKEREVSQAACSEEVRKHELEMLKKYSVTGNFGISNKKSNLEFNKLLKIVKEKFPEEHAFDKERIIESFNWWFIPRFYVGLFGYIIEKDSKNIFLVGSGFGDVWRGIEAYLEGEIEGC